MTGFDAGHRSRSGSLRALPVSRGPLQPEGRPRSRRRSSGRLLGLVASVFIFLAAAVNLSGCGPEAELEEPVPLFERVPIEYPLALWDEGVEGTTILRVRVSEGGSVDSTRILESSGHDAFDSAAVRGGRQLRFEPAHRNGEPVAVWAEVPVHFSLDAGEAPAAADADSASGNGS